MTQPISIPLPPALSVNRRWLWFYTWLAVLFVSIALVAYADRLGFRPWSGVAQDRIVWYHYEECEGVTLTRFLLQFSNFWSNFAYLAVGLILISLNDSLLGRLLGGAFCFLTFGSGYFHGSLSELGELLDIAGVYMALLAIIAYALIELFEWRSTDPRAIALTVAAFVFAFVAAIYRTKVWLFNSSVLTPLLVVAILVAGAIAYFKFKLRNEHKLLAPGLGALGFGLIALVGKFTDGDNNALARYGGDYAKCLYAPDAWFQGHASWHVLSAGMFYCMFEFFRSFRRRSRPVFPWRLAGS